jgi:SAM-dependent methyltransferase
MGRYVYDQGWEQEHQRLLGMARLWDAGTFALFERLGVATGWRCLEIGAGAGSVSSWLAERVGATGRVVAADIDPRYLEPLAGGALEVARIDVLSDELERGVFDLVYSRLVAEHLGSEAVRRMAGAVAPGGVLLLEDYDFSGPGAYPADPDLDRAPLAVLDIMTRSGFDPRFGRRLLSELRAAGLTDVQAEGRVRVFAGGTPDTAFARLTLTAMRERIVAAGALEAHLVDRAIAAFDDPERTFLSPTMIAGWGRRPAETHGS